MASVNNIFCLRELFLSHNKLKQFSAGIGNLVQLTILDASDNEFSSLPEEFGKCTSLKVLNLARNKLTALPSSVYPVEVSLNGIYCRSELFAGCCWGLWIVWFKGTLSSTKLFWRNIQWYLLLWSPWEARPFGQQVNSLPWRHWYTILFEEFRLIALGYLYSLKTLRLNENELETFPEGYSDLEGLEEFNISHNKLVC